MALLSIDKLRWPKMLLLCGQETVKIKSLDRWHSIPGTKYRESCFSIDWVNKACIPTPHPRTYIFTINLHHEVCVADFNYVNYNCNVQGLCSQNERKELRATNDYCDAVLLILPFLWFTFVHFNNLLTYAAVRTITPIAICAMEVEHICEYAADKWTAHFLYHLTLWNTLMIVPKTTPLSKASHPILWNAVSDVTASLQLHVQVAM